jgi:hypothetical protein
LRLLRRKVQEIPSALLADHRALQYSIRFDAANLCVWRLFPSISRLRLAPCAASYGFGLCFQFPQMCEICPPRHLEAWRTQPGLIVKGKRIARPPHPFRHPFPVPLRRDDCEHAFPLIRSLRASAQRSTSVLFSFVLCLLIMAGSFAIRQLKTRPERVEFH